MVFLIFVCLVGSDCFYGVSGFPRDSWMTSSTCTCRGHASVANTKVVTSVHRSVASEQTARSRCLFDLIILRCPARNCVSVILTQDPFKKPP